ncbi:copper resistance CopC family protein [Haloechinothrix salitolerans]|uniref:Copper resistance protein CopC n=1 Tax=Haloechinothrix salitolerans TaxID=926830 RepID=A0ABW2BTF3_9PSEU
MARTTIGTLVAVLALLGAAPQALAHNTLIGSDPKEGAEIDVAPRKVTLTFDQEVQSGDVNQIVVNGPDGGQWARGPVDVDGTEVSRALGELGPAGEYTIGFRILSADGHPVTREIPFTVTKSGTGTPVETPPAQQDAPVETPDAQDPSAVIPTWVWIGTAVLLLGVGIWLAVRQGREQ